LPKTELELAAQRQAEVMERRRLLDYYLARKAAGASAGFAPQESPVVRQRAPKQPHAATLLGVATPAPSSGSYRLDGGSTIGLIGGTGVPRQQQGESFQEFERRVNPVEPALRRDAAGYSVGYAPREPSVKESPAALEREQGRVRYKSPGELLIEAFAEPGEMI
jgi:hypothetical protein